MTYQKIEVTAEQRKNLIALAKYLLAGGVTGDSFSMVNYHDGPIGHGPAAGIPAFYREDYLEYSLRVFGSTFKDRNDWGFRWMFSVNWSEVDNSRAGAAKRIVKCLSHGVPASFCAPGPVPTRFNLESVEHYRNIPSSWPKILAAYPSLRQ